MIARLIRWVILAAFLAPVLGSCTSRPAAEAAKAAEAVALDPALAHFRALFVGIDHYRYSDAQVPQAPFSDLAGAVGDTLRLKAALQRFYGVALDAPASGACQSHNAIFITLTDGCATRAAILGALDAQVAAAKPGDTLLFYYAGHGSRYRDDTRFDQDSGYNGTILPADARNPDDPLGPGGDIFDTELRAIKDRATQAGIYFVTVFDSCNSATATRDGAAGQSRSVPPTKRRPPPPPALSAKAASGAAGGYWVHLAAAQDGEEAQESASGAVGKRAGVFTNALIETLAMPGMRHATFGDLIGEVRLRVATGGHVAQTPSAEGELTASLGRRAGAQLLLAATLEGDQAVLAGGSLSGITLGSRFALYASQADARQAGAALAEATVANVGPTSARLKLAAIPAKLPEQLVARETAHVVPPGLLAVANNLPAGSAQATVAALLRELEFVTPTPGGTTHLIAAENSPERVELRADDGTLLAELGPADAPGFDQQLTEELRKVARVDQLLALRTTGAATTPTAASFALTTCVAADGYRASSCPALQSGGIRRIAPGARFTATVINRGRAPAYLYLLAIDPRNSVTLVVPRRGEIDRKIGVGQPYRRAGIWTDLPGIYRFVALATDTPIRADAFEQSGNGTRGLDACASPLERLLCDANDGLRDVADTTVGGWSAQVTTVAVNEGDGG